MAAAALPPSPQKHPTPHRLRRRCQSPPSVIVHRRRQQQWQWPQHLRHRYFRHLRHPRRLRQSPPSLCFSTQTIVMAVATASPPLSPSSPRHLHRLHSVHRPPPSVCFHRHRQQQLRWLWRLPTVTTVISISSIASDSFDRKVCANMYEQGVSISAIRDSMTDRGLLAEVYPAGTDWG